MVIGEFQARYEGEGWQEFWHQFVQNYWDKNFRKLAYTTAISKYDAQNPGWFGGLGMTEEEARLFYSIGAGDGGWGAFYDISCLYAIRTLLFGFASNLKLIQGKFDVNGNFTPASHYREEIKDSLGRHLYSPGYLGIQTFA
jgi:tryptophan 2-monooxygenase